MIHSTRIKTLNDRPERDGDYVLYWMQQSQRAHFNHALEYAVGRANALQRPLVCVFGLTDRYPDANERHYAFMLEGLAETERALAERGIKFVLLLQSPDEAALTLAESAALVVTDRGYLRIQKQWRQRVAERAPCRVTQVETDVIVPLEEASQKDEWAAATYRPKVTKLLPAYLRAVEPIPLKRDSLGLAMCGEVEQDTEGLLARLQLDRSVPRVDWIRGGTREAMARFERFLEEDLPVYASLRNEPAEDRQSQMSPYLHFGQISPLWLALEARKRDQGESAAAFLEEMIVRRELSMNFVEFNPFYDEYEGLPEWARRTLDEHRGDFRFEQYSLEELEGARTADPYWNAAQTEMNLRGKMHGYLRMYWAKKILEWSETPEEAFRRALYLNNRLFLDGRDANGFTGVAWCFGKHDRPWTERPIFGKIRYMNANGLKRKFDMASYLHRIDALKE